MYQVQGFSEGNWSWEPVAESEDAVTFESKAEAEQAMEGLAQQLVGFNGWTADRLRVVEV